MMCSSKACPVAPAECVTVAPRWLKTPKFFHRSCWPPWNSQVQSTRLPSSFLTAQPLFYFISMSISSASDLSLISFAGSDSTLTWQGGDKRKRKRQEGLGGWRGDYFKYIFLKGGHYSREAINQGKAIIRGKAIMFDRVSPHFCSHTNYWFFCQIRGYNDGGWFTLYPNFGETANTGLPFFFKVLGYVSL